MTDSRPKLISFVLPAWNEAVLIGRTIDGIHAAMEQRDPRYEVVVADDASDDGTGDIAGARGARVVRCEHRQIAATRNAGAQASSGDVIIFVDADTIITRQVVEETIAAFESGAVGGGALPDFDGDLPLYARLILGPSMFLYRLARLVSGSYLFCTREAFDATGGFDESLYATEEAFMSRALRRHGKFTIIPSRVMTSGRKLRTHSAREILGTLARFGLRGMRSVRTRDGLDVWYGARRVDPEQPES